MFAFGCAWAWATFRSQFFNKRDPVCIIPLSSPLAPSACGDETTCADPRLQEQTWWHVQGSLPDDEAIEYTAEGNLRWEQQETRPTCCRLESRRSSCVRFPLGACTRFHKSPRKQIIQFRLSHFCRGGPGKEHKNTTFRKFQISSEPFDFKPFSTLGRTVRNETEITPRIFREFAPKLKETEWSRSP